MAGGGQEDRETLEPVARPATTHPPCPTLTILAHPDSSRVGERARLTGLLVRIPTVLSRQAPLFAQPGAGPPRALLDPYLSRTPVHLVAAPGGGVVVQGAVRVAGQAAGQVLGPARLEDGVVLELGDRVALLLHFTREDGPPVEALGLVGHNQAMETLRRHLLRVADLEVPVLIRGETGTGKELIARALHRASRRAAGPFVSVNIAAIPPATAASELFGHARGSFTGAASAHAGYFGQADGGTLFLDEIGATPAEVQPMLLRALESLEIQPLGVAAPRRVDVRVIAATDADLERAIAEGSFRAAVVHRLEGFQLVVPPLRERRDDIGRLIVCFLRAELATTGELSRLDADPPWLPAPLVARLAAFDWPGNVRQLRNVIRQLVIANRGAEVLAADAVLERLLGPAAETTPSVSRPLGALDDDALAEALREHDHQIGAAAAALGISRSALYARIKDSPRFRQAKDLSRDELVACRQRHGDDLAAMARQLEVSRRALALRLKELGL